MFKPSTAMVLSAGLGTRMRPVTNHMPKPLVKVGERTLLDYNLDALVSVGISNAVVNVHYLADMIEAHLAARDDIHIAISDERAELLETGGGVLKALPLLGHEPFLTMNTDSFWLEHIHQNLEALFNDWQPEKMDVLMLLVPLECAIGLNSTGDFELLESGEIALLSETSKNAYIYSGVAIHKPDLFRNDLPKGPFSLNTVWQDVRSNNRLFGKVFEGAWLHVGEPKMIEEAELFLKEMKK